MKVTHEWDWKGAEEEFRAAVRFNPSCAVAHHWHGLLLSYTRRFDEAKEKLLHAQTLDPLSPIINIAIANPAAHAGRFDEATKIFESAVDLAPKFVPLRLYYGLALEGAGRLQEAAKQFETGLETASGETMLIAGLGHCYGVMGRTDDARAILHKLRERRDRQYTSAYGIAVVAAGLGEEEEALHWLESAFEERAAWLCTIQGDARWNPFRGHPRFDAVVLRMNFPKM